MRGNGPACLSVHFSLLSEIDETSIGPNGTRSHLHKDSLKTQFWMAMVQGIKRWTVFLEEEEPLLVLPLLPGVGASSKITAFFFDRHPKALYLRSSFFVVIFVNNSADGRVKSQLRRISSFEIRKGPPPYSPTRAAHHSPGSEVLFFFCCRLRD